MGILRAQVEFDRDTTVEEDVVVNTFHFGTATTPPTTAQMDEVSTRLVDFYRTVNPGTTRSILSYMSNVIATTARIKFYSVVEGGPDNPLRVDEFNPTGVGGTALPEEAAVCLSFRAAAVLGTAMRRRRGRVYIGPLNTDTLEVVDGRVRVAQNFRDDLLDSAAVLYGDGEPSWGVLSLASAPDTLFNVVEAWVDDAFDTQRRRGPDPTGRTTRAFP